MRAAIERMRLAPVMFELGARPHPPRELYRSYLAQSDVFVGIYGESYGWVAPEEDVSGLEDEYNLAPPRDAEAHLHQGERPPRRTPQRADRPHPERRHRRVPPVQTADELGTGWSATWRRCSPSGSTSPAPATPRRMPRRRRPSSPACPRPTRRRSAASATSLRCASCSRAARTGWSRLIGPGGIGKSRLAIEVARAHRGPLPRRHLLRAARGRARAGPAAARRSPTPSASATTARPAWRSASRGRSRVGGC